MIRRISKTTSLLAIAFAMLGGGTALAQSPANEVYNPNGGVLDVVESGSPTPTPTPETSTAPETTSEAPSTDNEDTQTEAAPATTPAATATPTTETTQEATTGDLPFTGFEAGFVAMAGLALLAGGFAMRRMTRDQS